MLANFGPLVQNMDRDEIELETDSVTPKTPDNTHLMFYEKHKNILNVWRHLACILEFCI